MRVVLLLGLSYLLAGCLGEDAPEEASSPSTAGASATALNVPGTAPNATVETRLDEFAIDWSGSMHSGVWACEWQNLRMCQDVPLAEGQTNLLLDRIDGRVRALRVELAWTSTAPTTETLGFGAMVMTPDCDDCEGFGIAEAVGTSPVVLDAAGLDFVLEDGAVLHLYVWPASGSRVVGAAFVGANPAADPFTVVGAVTTEHVVE